MDKLNKVLQAIDYCNKKYACEECLYDTDKCIDGITRDAKELLEQYKPKLLTMQEVQNLKLYDVVWLETYWDGNTHLESLVLTSNDYQEPSLCNGITTIKLHKLHQSLIDSFSIDYNDTRYRFWSAKPSKENRKSETRWNTSTTTYSEDNNE